MTKVEDYQNKSIDFVVNDGCGDFTVEIKYSVKYPHSIFAEDKCIMCDTHYENDGWFRKCKADYVYWVSPLECKIYIVKTSHLKKWVYDGYHALHQCTTDAYKYSYGYIIPLDTFSESYPVKVIDLWYLYQSKLNANNVK